MKSTNNDGAVIDDLIPSRQEQAESLDETLLLLNRVVHAAVTSIVVTDPHLPDNPIVYHNPAFETISGYSAREIDGHNCRFLQGQDTDPATIATIRQAIATETHCQTVILNYTKDGTPFWNDLAISPVHDEQGRLTHFVGVQTDVTRRAEAERERDALLEQQKRIADTLQRALLLTPPATTMNGLEVSTQYEAAFDEAQFGGDFFDTVALASDKVALIVGDCTGKGLKAAQYTAEVKYALRVLLREYGHPTPALHRLNIFLMDSQRLDARDEEALVCVSVAVVNTQTGESQIANAGMEPPLIVRANKRLETIEASGLILGTERSAEYKAQSLTLEPDDVLILLTDGITESRGPRPRRDMFGYEGFTEVTAQAAAETLPIEEMGKRIVSAAIQFAEGRQQDDICVLLARRTGIIHSEDVSSTPLRVSADREDAAVRADGDLAHFALEVTNLGYWELDTKTGIARRSARHDEIFGFDPAAPPSEWNYQRFLSHIYTEDYARVDALYGQALATGTDWNFECRIIRASDGALRWIEARGRHFHHAEDTNASTRIIGTIADITERKEAEQVVQKEVRLRQEAYALAERIQREANDQLRFVTDAAPLLISYVDTELRYRFVNQGYAEWFGRPKEEIVGKTVAEVIGQAAFQASQGYIASVLAGEKIHYEATLPYDEGRNTRHIRADMIPDKDDDGTVRGYVAVVADETKRKQAEDEAQTQRNEAANIFERVTDAFAAFDHDWRFTYLNPTAERLIGRSASDLLGKNHWEEFEGTLGSIVETEYRRAVRDQVQVTFEVYYGPMGWLAVRAFPSPTGLSVYFRDITAEKEAAVRQRTFLKEMLFGFTEGRLRLCFSPTELPSAFPPACAPVDLFPTTMRMLRKQVESVGEEMRFAKERLQDLETAVGEAAMNAVRHASGGVGRVHVDPDTGAIQVWIQDTGDGIDENLIHRAIERGWTTGGFGQGMFLMHRSIDRMYLLTGPGGTTVVLEQDRTPPAPPWMMDIE